MKSRAAVQEMLMKVSGSPEGRPRGPHKRGGVSARTPGIEPEITARPGRINRRPAKPGISTPGISTPGFEMDQTAKTRESPVKPAAPPIGPDLLAQELGEATWLRSTHDEIRTLLDAITGVTRPTQMEPSVRVEFSVVVELGKKSLVQVRDVVRAGELRPVSAPQLEGFMETLQRTVEKVGTETAARAAEEILRDNSSAETLSMLAEKLEPLADVASQVATKMEPTDALRRNKLKWWILAGATLLAAGLAAFVPLVRVSAAEGMLANELALAAVVASFAAWLGKK
jgi:hypothetical protein